MFSRFTICGILLLVCSTAAAAGDRETLESLFSQTQPGDTVKIAPRRYFLDGSRPIQLPSQIRVEAYGAEFHFPEKMTTPKAVMFSGVDLYDFTWNGGKFVGHVFDPDKPQNVWPPNTNSRGIVISTSSDGTCRNLRFREIQSQDLAGAAITVTGRLTPGSQHDVDSYVEGVRLDECRLLRTGKFMWDYGYLWQIIVWPEEATPRERELAKTYFRHDLIREGLSAKKGETKIDLGGNTTLKTTPRDYRGQGCVCFFGQGVPSPIVRGKKYFVVESDEHSIAVSETYRGEPIRLEEDSGPDLKLITDVFQAHLALYAPTGSGPGKGSFDLVGCQDVIVQGSQFSALGDTMHIQRCKNITFSNNQILGSRMGAFFLAEYCQNAVIVGNTVDGSNGSRVVSVEKSCQDVVIVGNTFRNGGRGSWINQPRNFVLANNVFVNNTTKCEPQPGRGRKSFETGDYEDYPELYFTTHEPNGRYGNVIVRDNVFVSGEHSAFAIECQPGGQNITIRGNTFSGAVQSIEHHGCKDLILEDNQFTASEQN